MTSQTVTSNLKLFSIVVGLKLHIHSCFFLNFLSWCALAKNSTCTQQKTHFSNFKKITLITHCVTGTLPFTVQSLTLPHQTTHEDTFWDVNQVTASGVRVVAVHTYILPGAHVQPCVRSSLWASASLSTMACPPYRVVFSSPHTVSPQKMKVVLLLSLFYYFHCCCCCSIPLWTGPHE